MKNHFAWNRNVRVETYFSPSLIFFLRSFIFDLFTHRRLDFSFSIHQRIARRSYILLNSKSYLEDEWTSTAKFKKFPFSSSFFRTVFLAQSFTSANPRISCVSHFSFLPHSQQEKRILTASCRNVAHKLIASISQQLHHPIKSQSSF